ncbi:hypothetical protein HF086_003228 [Spodoptera exigua]|uniref:Acyltransferase 3 domain-containing protein n=1 Tax=Spodoptera exigua TaxID=7107 RepID=A0A922SGC5_SPOEX|nr:hypothetical protein HF086_003228 [Spodoptera exigua]
MDILIKFHFRSLILLFVTILFFSTLYETYTIYYGNNKDSLISTLIISFSMINNMKKIISTKQHNSLGLECVSGIKALAMIFIIAGHACMFIASGPVMDADAWDRADEIYRSSGSPTLIELRVYSINYVKVFSLDLLVLSAQFYGVKGNQFIWICTELLIMLGASLKDTVSHKFYPQSGLRFSCTTARLIFKLVRQPANAFMLNNTLLVDTFLMLSAFLFSRLLLVELDKRRGKLNVIPILIFRYIRVTPAYLVVILFYMTWLPKMGEGPLWQDRLLLEQERCMTSWWTNILYINNYVNTDKMCMFQSWYLSVDTQLFFIAPIFIYSLWRWRKFGPILVSVALFISLIVPAVITYRDNLDPTLLFYANYQFTLMMKTFGWIIGLLLGVVSTFTVTIFYQEWYQYNAIEAAAYISLHKLAWGISNGWLIIACATGNGGILGKLLTWKFLAPFSRLTFCAYLVNGIVELYYVGELRHPLHITFFTVMANAISHIVLTFFLAMFLCLTFESPLHGIEKILLRMFARPVLSDNARKEASSVESSRNTSQSKLDS